MEAGQTWQRNKGRKQTKKENRKKKQRQVERKKSGMKERIVFIL
jgi:hypothetical protein